MTTLLASLLTPAVILLVSGLLLLPGRKIGDAFLTGAKNGMQTAFGLLPTLVLFLSAVTMLDASGLTDRLILWLEKPAAAVGIPPEILPLLVIRPLSGAGANAYLADLLSRYGADSPAGLCASVIAASSDTIFYIFAVYFAAGNVRKTRYAVPAALAVMLFCTVFSAALCRRFF